MCRVSGTHSADFTYVWTAAGFCYVSFITDVYSRRILGWRVSMSKTSDLVTAALAQALATRRRASSEFTASGLIHHSDAGSQLYSSGVHRRTRRSRDRRVDRHGR